MTGRNQVEDIAWLCAEIAHDARRVHRAEDRKAVLRFAVVDRMAAHDGSSCLSGLFGAAAQDVARYVIRQRAVERKHVQADQWTAAHCENVRERICCGNASEIVRFVHHRGEEVHCEHARQMV